MIKFLSEENEYGSKIYRAMDRFAIAVIDTETGIVYQTTVNRVPWIADWRKEVKEMLESGYLD